MVSSDVGYWVGKALISVLCDSNSEGSSVQDSLRNEMFSFKSAHFAATISCERLLAALLRNNKWHLGADVWTNANTTRLSRAT